MKPLNISPKRFLLWAGLVLSLVIPCRSFANALDHWTWRFPLPQGNPLRAVTFGNGTFVAVGDSGTVVTSSNGGPWTVELSGTTNGLQGVAFGNDTFIAVGVNGILLTSSDGKTWAARESGTGFGLWSVGYWQGTFLAVGGGGTILSSSNGLSWTAQTSGTSVSLSALTYGAGKYLVSRGDGNVLVSTNGTDWAEHVTPIRNGWLSAVAYGGGVFVASGAGLTLGRPPLLSSVILRSSDGVNWTQYFGLSGAGIIYVNGIFVMVGGEKIQTSADGISWTNQTPAASDYLYGIAYGDGTFVTVGSFATIQSSENGLTWTNHTRGFGGGPYEPRNSGGSVSRPYNLNRIAFGNGHFVVLAEGIGLHPLTSAAIFSSSNGVTYTPTLASGSTPGLKAIIHANGEFYGAGLGGTVLRSVDGFSWVSNNVGSSVGIQGLTFGDGLLVGIGNYGTNRYILRSTDGSGWDIMAFASSGFLNAITFGNGRFVVCEYLGAIWASDDGITWSSANSGATNRLYDVAYGKDRFVAVGDSGTILTSLDGMTWARVASGTTNQLNCVTYGNCLLAVGGESGTFLTSLDGVSWTKRWLGTVQPVRGVTYGNDSFTVVGNGFSSGNSFILQSESIVCLTGKERFDQDGFELILRGPSGRRYDIEISADLMAWTNLFILTNVQSETQFSDAAATNAQKRFYRARLIP